ncbi:hypothetical protein BRADI_2g24717v3 [Brachypodium distachyon]|uniref:Uncharacterized protein n=2 Tax=Brachypodium distachyon TaxID=15368 RepID=A0A0Q3MPJ6_BRADI|nr:hypothetical protein BRADI_2g24717v3 [Brachypodium distachyon]KQK06128.1 hypothetical protein BRADI_2g24717v3 [Brachypodium distachyon]PNT71197.1 hypothetical protein BRADI_2g24717v3 [Brachypodium distachyon]
MQNILMILALKHVEMVPLHLLSPNSCFPRVREDSQPSGRPSTPTRLCHRHDTCYWGALPRCAVPIRLGALFSLVTVLLHPTPRRDPEDFWREPAETPNLWLLIAGAGYLAVMANQGWTFFF